MGDASPETIWSYAAKQKQEDPYLDDYENSMWTPYILLVVYVMASFFIMVIMLNIIIAIMGDTQSKRTELGRAVIYKNQLRTILDSFYRFNDRVNVDRWVGTRTGKYRITPGKELDEENLVKVYQAQFPRYLTVAFKRSVEEEDDTTTILDLQGKQMDKFEQQQ